MGCEHMNGLQGISLQAVHRNNYQPKLINSMGGTFKTMAISTI